MLDLRQFLLIPVFWLVGFPPAFARFFAHWNIAMDRNLGVSLTVRYLAVPLFGDYTIAGRIIGGIYRFVALIIFSFFILVCDLFLVVFFLLWYVFPLLLFYYLDFWSVLILAVLVFCIFIYRRDRHVKTVFQISDYKHISDAFPHQVRRVFSNYDPNKPHQLLLNLLNSHFFVRFLLKIGLSESLLRELLQKTPLPSLTYDKLSQEIYKIATKTNSRLVFSEHIFFVFYDQSKKLQEALLDTNIHRDDIFGALSWLVEDYIKNNPPKMWDEDYKVSPIGGVDRARTSRPTPHLDSVSEDLTWKASRNLLPKAVGKEQALESIIRALSRSGHEHVLIIGEPGSGKTTLVGGLAQEIIAGTYKDSLQFKRLVSLNPSALGSYATSIGGMNDKLTRIIKEIEAAGNIILFIDEIHNLAAAVQEEAGESSSAYAALQPHLSSHAFQIIGTTDYANYKKYIEPNGAFARLFQKVELKEATLDQSLSILRAVSLDIEHSERVLISFPALRQAVNVSDQVIYDRVLPDKAVDLLDEAVSYARESSRAVVTADDVLEVAQRRTGIPIKNITGQESGALLNLEELIHKQVISQQEAISAVANALRRARAGLTAKGRPLASFLFVGPTGVGKTETAKALANAYFGGEKRMIRFDMSEYQEKSSLDRLIGPPQGHPDAASGGQLTEAVRRQPFSLVLLDEIEKAHPDILLLFLQVLDDARLTDGMGRTVNFSNTIIIATSNVGTAAIQEGISRGQAYDQIKEEAMISLQQRFKPELLNRFDGIITFQPLAQGDVLQITRLLLKDLAKRVAEKDIRLECEEDLIEALSRNGFSNQWGARPLRRLVQDKLEAPLAKLMISGQAKKGDLVKLDARFLETGKID
ncbi:hypothetical protein COT52_01250 [candidate division WWE3 bacterium CG08_land_8_20_14_0_20_43_13]|uniref:Clp R domain-containing protein n=1 Tax=candidate division WWE3 bacterium CG08_land_8_20_14_0_20_43_13 TaxID=1975087 RepID=A0A2H0X9S4_UNCKA|nr:MAG: hypothetical protein COT52_01250 [candidate division WWE3 bacterium CG08_land_8_20_14_0_20_43_13]